MPLRKRPLFATLLTTVALTAAGTACIYRVESAAPKPKDGSRAAALAGKDGAANRSVRRLNTRDELPQAFLVPIQFRDPDNLGVGKLLVASRGLGDPSFAGTVVLLVHYDASAGVLGLVLNRRTEVPISRVLDLKSAKDRSDPVYAGGPVEPRAVFALFNSPARIDQAENTFGRVYFISGKTLFDQTLSAHPDPSVFHVYLGYTGWTVAQLRHEVQVGAWNIFPADDAAVFTSDPDSLWNQMIQKTKLQLASTEPLTSFSP